MAFLKIDNVRIKGLSTCVPKRIEENVDFPVFNEDSYKNFVSTTGIERRRICEKNICASDLCIAAAERLISDLQWIKEDISFLIFVTQMPDYIIPATSPLIQEKLGLSTDCYTLDISLGCSGWVYAFNVAASLVCLSGKSAKALVLAGDTPSKVCCATDKSAYPLFGDAGTATALEYSELSAPTLFNMNSDGKGYLAIHINDGGFRNETTKTSFEPVNRGEGIVSNNLQLVLDGMDVFAFGIKFAPENVNKLLENFKLNKEKIDYFTFHQANLLMNEQIRKKLKLNKEKTPYSLKDFGNTSSATIPLTMATELRYELMNKKLSHIACGFGVGLSWGSVYFETDRIICSELIEI